MFSLTDNKHLFSALFVGLILRLYFSYALPIHPDEWYNLNLAILPSTSAIYDIWISSPSVHPIGIYLINHFQFKIFGPSIFTMRILTSILGTTTIFLTYKISYILFNKNIAEISAWGISLFSIFIDTSAIIRGYPFIIFLSCLAILNICYISKDKATNKNWLYFLFSLISLSYIHYFGTLFSVISLYLITHISYKMTDKILKINTIVILMYFLSLFPLIFTTFEILKNGTGGTVGYTNQFMSLELPIIILSRFLNGSRLIVYVLMITFFFNVLFLKSENSFYQYPNGSRITIAWLLLPLFLALFISILFEPIITPNNLVISSPAVVIMASVILNDAKIKISKETKINIPNLIIPILLFTHLIFIHEIQDSHRPDLELPFLQASEISEDSDIILLVNSDRWVIPSVDGYECWSCHHFTGNVSDILIGNVMGEKFVANLTNIGDAKYLVLFELSGDWVKPFSTELKSNIENSFNINTEYYNENNIYVAIYDIN